MTTKIPKDLIDPTVEITEGTKQTGTGIETEFDFSSIPSGTKKIVISFHNLVLSGTDDILVQIGDSGGLETSGYLSHSGCIRVGSTSAGGNSASGFIIDGDNFTYCSGHKILTRTDEDGDEWVSSHSVQAASTKSSSGGGHKILTAELDRLRVKPSGSNTISSGSVNIAYE